MKNNDIIFFTDQRSSLEKGVCKLPRIKSAKKRVKVIAKKTLRNKMIKSSLKTAIRKYEATIAGADRATGETALRQTIKKIDQAVAKGVIHKNTAARKKSKLALKLNSMGA